jgi:XTP/dITP diphosphohydrolase
MQGNTPAPQPEPAQENPFAGRFKNKNRYKRKKNFNAKFVCSLTFYYNKIKKITTIGVVEGKISNKLLGKKGFGYDPIFIPKSSKITFGQ